MKEGDTLPKKPGNSFSSRRGVPGSSNGALKYSPNRKSYLRNKKPTGDDLTHKIEIPHRRAQALFGNCYPSLTPISTFTKRYFLQELVRKEVSEHVKVEDDYQDLTFEFSVGGDGRMAQVESYKVALKLEKWVKEIPQLGTLAPPRWWNNFWWSEPRSDIFCVDEVDRVELIQWLRANKLRARDYQLFSKFGGDTSIAFRNQQQATMFKLQFAEKV